MVTWGGGLEFTCSWSAVLESCDLLVAQIVTDDRITLKKIAHVVALLGYHISRSSFYDIIHKKDAESTIVGCL